MAERSDEVADRLYGLPLEDFTRERDEAAKALRREKRRDVAAEVARLPKPGPGPWAVNAIARERPALRDELLEAGEALRTAQDAAIAGRGAKELRAATARQRAAVDALLDAAAKLRPGGRGLSATAIDRLRRTLHAAAGDDEVRAAIAAGRLIGDAEGGGAWPFGPGAAEDAEAKPTAKRKPAAKRKAAAKGEAAAKGKAAAKRGEEPTAAKRRAADRDAAGRRKAADREAAGRRKAADREAAERRKAADREAAERRNAEKEAAARRLELETRLAGARRDRTRRERELTSARREAERAADRLGRAESAAEDARHAVARIEEQLD